MDKRFCIDAFAWGCMLWVFGYFIGILLFAFIPAAFLGWAIMPLGILFTLWALTKKIHGDSFQYYLLIASVWTLIAILADYFFLVKLLKPPDGYYKLDVYIYYILTFALPLSFGWRKHT